MVTFTGSAEVGLRIRSRAGMKRVTLEPGNNSAVIVCADADVEDAAARCVPGAYANSGQVCISVQRIFADETIHAGFVERFAAQAAQLPIGHPLDENAAVTSLITESEAQRVVSWIGEAIEAGAKLAAGGGRHGATVQPAVLADVPPRTRIFAQEAFGPVAGINRFSELDEAIAAVNDSPYGLQASIFTRDIEKAFRAARRVHVGGFLINDYPADFSGKNTFPQRAEQNRSAARLSACWRLRLSPGAGSEANTRLWRRNGLRVEGAGRPQRRLGPHRPVARIPPPVRSRRRAV
jgi:acyl-CoA reductase-like NAD-dependent aldehyde dehydrogenase